MLSVTVNLTVTPIEATVVSDKRIVKVTVAAAGETAVGTATFPVTITDPDRTWIKKSDNGSIAVYTG